MLLMVLNQSLSEYLNIVVPVAYSHNSVQALNYPINTPDSLLVTEIDQNKDRMLEILEGKGLSFLFPLLKLEKELLKQIKADPSPQSIYKWIKDNISPKLHTDKGFVNILMTRYIC